MTTLVIANKCYSSWSLRPWILMKELGIPFEEVMIPLDLPDTKARVIQYSPAGKVPVLIDGDATVWETTAIIEHLAETRPEAGVWPKERAARAMARSIVSEMHAGFGALRSHCPMNLGKRYAYRDRGDGVAQDAVRITSMWREARERFGVGGPFLFGAFSAADAMYAPVVTRLDTYAFPVDPATRAYMDAVLGTPSFRAWREAALTESWIVDADEVADAPLENFRSAA